MRYDAFFINQHFTMRPLILLCLLVLISNTLKAQDYGLYQRREFTSVSGQKLPYRILFPENYNPTKKYPLLLFLHGGGERGNDNEKQLVHGAKQFLTEENRKNFPAIVVFPQCPVESYWGNVKIDRSTSPLTLTFDYSQPQTPALKAAIELVQFLIKEEGVNEKQVYIAGLSMGGMGTFEAVYRYPKLFAAAVPICGGGDAVRYDKRINKIPFRIFHGSADAVVDVKYSQQMVEKLKALKATVLYTEYPGVNHNSWDNAFAEPDFLNWMFANKK
jgi:predicted peptidase